MSLFLKKRLQISVLKSPIYKIILSGYLREYELNHFKCVHGSRVNIFMCTVFSFETK